MADNVIETDVLVIGGGLSGIFAGIKARELGVDVTMVEKGYVGKTGAALFASNTSIFNPEWGHNLKDWLKQIAETGDYMNNPEWTEITLRESYARYQDMVSFGIQYPGGKDGELVMLPQRRVQLLSGRLPSEGHHRFTQKREPAAYLVGHVGLTSESIGRADTFIAQALSDAPYPDSASVLFHLRPFRAGLPTSSARNPSWCGSMGSLRTKRSRSQSA